MSGSDAFFNSFMFPSRENSSMDRGSLNLSPVPSIRVESASYLSSEPLDPELWDQLSTYSGGSSRHISSSSRGSSVYSPEEEHFPHERLLYLSPFTSRSGSPAGELEEPPNYHETVQRPTTPVTYNFSTLSFNSMVLIPHTDDESVLRPKYHISIAMNCFNPFSHITTVRRGGSGYGALVGEFEMGISDNSATLTRNGKTHEMKGTLKKKGGSRSSGFWAYDPPGKARLQRFYWDCRTVPFLCHRINVNCVLSEFTPCPLPKGIPKSTRFNENLQGMQSSPSTSKLFVYPEGQKQFDDILMALLMVERKRLIPAKDRSVKQLFS